MTSYFRLMLGKGSIYAAECVAGNFIGVDFGIEQNLTHKLPDEWREFNKEFIPIYLKKRPEKTRVAAGLACGAVWTVAKGIEKGDIILSPDGEGHYHVGEVIGDYEYKPGGILYHRRPVRWLTKTINRADMSEALRHSAGSTGTVGNISGYHDEIEGLIGGARPPTLISTDETVEDPSTFALEEHLEEFLVQNWTHTELGKEYDIFEDEDETSGQQYATDTGEIDVLAISKDKKRLLVVELKRGRASDAVVGQVLRYMGYVQEELAEKNQTVYGAIIALDDDQRIRRALAIVPNIEFYRYQVSFKLVKG